MPFHHRAAIFPKTSRCGSPATALANAASTHPEPLPISDFAASMQSAISACLVNRSAIAMEAFISSYKHKEQPSFVVAGGVAANTQIREDLQILASSLNFTMVLPPLEFCTDNAAMILPWFKCTQITRL